MSIPRNGAGEGCRWFEFDSDLRSRYLVWIFWFDFFFFKHCHKLRMRINRLGKIVVNSSTKPTAGPCSVPPIRENTELNSIHSWMFTYAHTIFGWLSSYRQSGGDFHPYFTQDIHSTDNGIIPTWFDGNDRHLIALHSFSLRIIQFGSSIWPNKTKAMKRMKQTSNQLFMGGIMSKFCGYQDQLPSVIFVHVYCY